ncbi:hypothetical protein SAMN04488030_1723 [Aliiroseovarius halocynthiae]|uniref:Carboxymuconolactone decarboxylase family protein n=1 Tax=Aliiroseovarius halocynthiae TaxID=985055 RepID=A0A545SSC4_9RHOB|nr:hypothetical protein [Aliiroseovarius halocynthiae]TQV67880.1 hypothetical protein FIL88_08525 [Aliiroseovarius halocynthiae]SMR72974.1 hypothetical protein SAMN04488030_1723 [Aliiroseovarius halocynthiae]
MTLIKNIAQYLVRRAERRVGVQFDYVHAIADTSIGLLSRYNRLFGFLDPRKHLPPHAYHAARLRGALAADCGTCVEAEINLAISAGCEAPWIKGVLSGNGDGPIADVIALTDAVVRDRTDLPEARDAIARAYGQAGLIELTFAMNGAALLPGVKRAMGYATACDLSMMKKLA